MEIVDHDNHHEARKRKGMQVTEAASNEGKARSAHVVGATRLQAASGPETFVAHRLGGEWGGRETN